MYHDNHSPECYIDYQGNSITPLPDWADNNRLLELYKAMLVTRQYDHKAVALQRTGKLGTYPSHLGAEAIGVAIGDSLEPDDVFVPYYRDMPAMYMRGMSMYHNLLYWGGDERGSDFPGPDFPFAVPIATQCTHAVGIAAALKIQAKHQAVLVTCGDGATSKGDFLESINCAGVWNLPVVFVINNNQWAISIPRHLQSAASTLADKAVGAGIKQRLVDGNDIVAMHQAISESLHDARHGRGAALIEAISYRLSDHTTADDASRYRSQQEVDEAWLRDPIARIKQYLTAQQVWSEDLEVTYMQACNESIEQAVQDYLNTSKQPPESSFDYLYEQLDENRLIQRQHIINKATQSTGEHHD